MHPQVHYFPRRSSRKFFIRYVRDGQTHPHRPRLVVSHSTCPPLSSSPHAHSFVIGPAVIKHTHSLRTDGHTVRSQHQVTASAGQRHCNVEIKSYLQDVAGHSSLVFDLSITHDRIGSSGHVQKNGLLSHPQDLDAPLRLAAQRKVNSYPQKNLRGSARGHRILFASSDPQFEPG